MSNTKKIKKRRLFITLGAIFTLTISTAAVILFAKGYRFNPQKGSIIKGTGLLSVTSQPKSAQVYIDGKLVTATDDTLNLPPATYKVRIQKQGYIPWEKDLPIEAQLVTTTDAHLFPSVPSLTALTYTDSKNPTPSPNGQKLAYIVQSNKNKDLNGLYVLDLTNSLLPLKRQPTQIASSTDDFDFTQATIVWSPDSKQILTVTTNQEDQTITNSFLLDSDQNNQLSITPDVTIQLPLIFTGWEQELTKQETQHLSNLPDFMFNVATASAKNIYFSPDGEKMLYTATQQLTIPPQLDQPLASTNPTPQQRDIKPDQLYIYDIKEDTNFNLADAPTTDSYPTDKILLFEASPTPTQADATVAGQQELPAYNRLQKDRTPLQTLLAFKAHYSALFTNNPQWFPTSRHLITTTQDQIIIKEYDNKNPASIYSGPFDNTFVYPTPNGDRLILRANLNQNQDPLNLYTLNLK